MGNVLPERLRLIQCDTARDHMAEVEVQLQARDCFQQGQAVLRLPADRAGVVLKAQHDPLLCSPLLHRPEQRDRALQTVLSCQLLLELGGPLRGLVDTPSSRALPFVQRCNLMICQCAVIEPHLADVTREVVLLAEADLQRPLHRQVVILRVEWR